MKIIALQAENVKRLVAVEIRPDGNVVEITGRNGQGKTSVLDSIWWALGGAKNVQADPIRRDSNEAKIVLDMGEITVTRTFERKKEGDGFTTSITVTGAKGSPQAILDGLLGSLTFDPLAFARMKPREQFDTLKQFVPGCDLDKLAADNQIDFAQRTDINRRAKEARAIAKGIDVPPNAPFQKLDDAKLIEELGTAGQRNADTEIRSVNRKKFADRIKECRDQAEALLQEATDIETKLKNAPPLPAQIDITGLQQKIEDCRKANEHFALFEQKQAAEKNADKLEAEATKLTKQIDDRNDQKRKAIEAAQLPVPGITFGDAIVMLNGVPFEQGSDAEQLKASIALAMAGNPKLRVIRVRDGSLLDEQSMKILCQMADEKDYQVWIERVDSSGKVGFVIEDGHLANVKGATVVQPAAAVKQPRVDTVNETKQQSRQPKPQLPEDRI